jgi:vacuolar-type H+-ATPase subunit F/Vma7
MNKNKIIVFGCWGDSNNIDNNSNNIDNNNKPWFKTVFNEIKNEKNVDFFIVNGDNYYQKKNKDKEEEEDNSKESILVSIPDTATTTTTSKSKKKKSTDKEVEEKKLIDGFENFFTLLDEKRETQELFLLMGNHDLESINDVCETTILEIEQVNNYNNGKERIHLPTNLTMFKEINKTLFIMIDTNIYTDDIKKHVNCYDIIIHNNNNNNNNNGNLKLNDTNIKEEKIKTLINHQSNLILDELKEKKNTKI